MRVAGSRAVFLQLICRHPIEKIVENMKILASLNNKITKKVSYTVVSL